MRRAPVDGTEELLKERVLGVYPQEGLHALDVLVGERRNSVGGQIAHPLSGFHVAHLPYSGVPAHVEAVLVEFQLLEAGRGAGVEVSGTGVDAHTGHGLGVLLCSSYLWPFLQHANAQAALGQVGCGGGAVVASADDDDVVSLLCGHISLLPREISHLNLLTSR